MTRRFALALLALALLVAPPAFAAEHTAAGLALETPDDAKVETLPADALPDHVRVVQVTRGEEVLLVTVYGGEEPPTMRQARAIHTEELERMATRQAEAIETGKFEQRILERKRSGREVRWTLDGVALLGRVVAGRMKGHTVVAAWVRPAELEAPMSPGVIGSLRRAED